MENKTVRVLERKLVTNKSYENLCQVVTYHLVINNDYRTAIETTKEYLYLIKELNLLYVIAYNAIEWQVSPRDWINEIENRMEQHEKKDLAIYYYLKAFELKKSNKYHVDLYIDYLRRSIQMSQGFCFANNRLDLSRVLSPKEAKRYYDDAIQNITNIYMVEEALIEDEDELLDVDKWIEENILGIRMNSSTYQFIRRSF